MTHHPDDADVAGGLGAPQRRAQHVPARRWRTVAGRPGVKMQVYPHNHAMGDEPVQVRDARDGQVDAMTYGGDDVHLDGIEPAQHGCPQAPFPQRHRLGQTRDAEPGGTAVECSAGHIHRAVPKPSAFTTAMTCARVRLRTVRILAAIAAGSTVSDAACRTAVSSTSIII